MTSQETSKIDLIKSAYAIAWKEFSNINTLTPDEKISGPNKLRGYIQVLFDAQERDPIKIAHLAFGMMREYEQIVRSKARVESAEHRPR
jgi:hypothetical protein